MTAIFVFLVPLSVVMFIYWLGGGNFERTDALAFSFVIGIAFGGIALGAYIGELDDRKKGRL